jgi:hypothetical protein
VADEVHHQEGDVAHDIDPTQMRVEVDAVERNEAALPTHDVARVQVAVAFADVSALLTVSERTFQRTRAVVRPVGESLQVGRLVELLHVCLQLLQIVRYGFVHLLGVRLRGVRRRRARSPVKQGQQLAQHPDFVRRHVGTPQQSGQFLLRFELRHAHRVFDNRS